MKHTTLKIFATFFTLSFAIACSEPPPAESTGTPAVKAAADSYCALAQNAIVSTDLTVENFIHLDFNTFVKSKPAARALQALHAQQFTSRFRFTPAAVEMNAAISCKFKSADEIAAVYGADQVGEQGSCAALLRSRLAAVHETLASVTPKLEGMVELGVREDELARIGPSWLRPWPYEFLQADEQGLLTVGAKALHVAFDSMIPMPKHFKGTYYCHFPSDEYLAAILRAELGVNDTAVSLNTPADT